jgi:eukaryotic-like serine/threonine-protein kinase
MSTAPFEPPAAQLTGLRLEGGWTVLERYPISAASTGGFFSYGYIVKHDNGTRAFLKALDFFATDPNATDPLRAMQDVIVAFNFERDVLERCGNRNLRRVVRALASSQVRVPAFAALGLVPYIIFELADGDLRAQLATRQFDTALRLRTAHQIAVALGQLHSLGIAHQDLKPSNVLVFASEGSKIGDLGRAILRGAPGPNDVLDMAGHPAYAPPELRYGYAPSDWPAHRLGCDVFLLGSMIVFLFSGMSMSSLLYSEVDPSHRPDAWGGRFHDVLPHLRRAFGIAVSKIEPHLPTNRRTEVLGMVRELCDPDPSLRGDPVSALRGSSRYDLQRYVSRLDVLATEAGFLTRRSRS